MTFTLYPALLQPIVALLAGILILIVPRILNYVVAIYLILVGVLADFRTAVIDLPPLGKAL
jgi:hypothetical protein